MNYFGCVAIDYLVLKYMYNSNDSAMGKRMGLFHKEMQNVVCGANYYYRK